MYKLRRESDLVSVEFKPWYPRKLAETADAVSSVVDSSVEFPDWACYFPIVKNEIIEWDVPLEPVDLTFKRNRGSSALQWIFKHVEPNGLSVRYDIYTL